MKRRKVCYAMLFLAGPRSQVVCTQFMLKLRVQTSISELCAPTPDSSRAYKTFRHSAIASIPESESESGKSGRHLTDSHNVSQVSRETGLAPHQVDMVRLLIGCIPPKYGSSVQYLPRCQKYSTVHPSPPPQRPRDRTLLHFSILGLAHSTLNSDAQRQADLTQPPVSANGWCIYPYSCT